MATLNILEERKELEGLSLDLSELTLQYGNTVQLKAAVTPADATGVTISWESDNAEVVTVSDIGILSTNGVSGTANITCTATDGENTFTKTCVVTVPDIVPVESIRIGNADGQSVTELTVYEGETIQLKSLVTPADATVKAADWASDKPGFAQVDHLGNVTAKAPGTATITAISKDNSDLKATCTIKVVKRVAGDVSGDGKVNGLDVTKIIGAIHNRIASTKYMDLNNDGKVNGVDITKIIGAIHGRITLS